MANSAPPSHVVITGPMGSGKTTVGLIVADRLGRRFVDSDDQIEATLQTDARQISQRRGVSELHQIEAEALRLALDHPEPAVIAAAASVADLDELGAMLDGDEFVVVLAGDPEVLHERAAGDDHRRPMSIDTAKRLASTRSRRLQEVADFEVDVTATKPEAIADIIISALHEAARI